MIDASAVLDALNPCMEHQTYIVSSTRSTRAFMFPKKPNMTPAEALSILAKLEVASKSESEESYV